MMNTEVRTGRRRLARRIPWILVTGCLLSCGDSEVFDQRRDLVEETRYYRVDEAVLSATFDDAERMLRIEVPGAPERIQLSGPTSGKFAFVLEQATRGSGSDAGAIPGETVATDPGSRGSFNSTGNRLRLDVDVGFADGQTLSIHGLGDRIATP